jgi:ribonuclease T2
LHYTVATVRYFIPTAVLLCAALTGGRNSSTPTPIADIVASDRPAEQSAYQPNSQRESRRTGAASTSTPGTFDFYLLNLSWSPEYCATHSNSPECASDPGFVLHGLWPQNFNGTYPENCGSAAGPTGAAPWPTASLMQHEWVTHGTCSGLSAAAYVATVQKALQAVQVPKNMPVQPEPPTALIGQFTAINPGFPAASFALSCGNNRLTAIEVCMAKDLSPIACQGVKSCRANVVKITPR